MQLCWRGPKGPCEPCARPSAQTLAWNGGGGGSEGFSLWLGDWRPLESLPPPPTALGRMSAKPCLNLDFVPRMLTWEKGGIPEDGLWAKHWYTNTHASTGFQPEVQPGEPHRWSRR